MTEKLLDVELVEDGGSVRFLILTVATDLSATQALRPTCTEERFVAFVADSDSPAGSLQLALLWKTATAAKLGPYRAKLWIVQDECVEIPGRPGSTFPLATTLSISALRP
jgi:hypothetical protein